MTHTDHPALRKAIAAQQSASDPEVSAFVDANAGAGKTAVLTARVARLLLAGAEPSKILCITYTKAAAAEMAGRLLDLLGGWALAGDTTLAGALAELEGPAFRVRDAQGYGEARRLFARALETPGGLKIQTIHSFCENVLRRFPLEAGTAPGFCVIDEAEAGALAFAAFESALGEPPAAAAVTLLTARLEPDSLADLVRTQTLSRQKIDDAREAAGGWAALQASAAGLLGVAPGETGEIVIEAAIAALDKTLLRRARTALDASGGNPAKYCGKPIGDFFAAATLAEKREHLEKLFTKSDGAPRASFGTKATAAIDPQVEAILLAMQQPYLLALQRAKAADNFADTCAFLTLMDAVSEAYAALKAARAGLDYDDLVAKTRALFRSGAGDWVRYKLDQGLDHVLLDEAQDTSPAQWDVVEAPLEEFFASKGERGSQRTLFAVGDKKQSIYSFQGADADLFDQKQLDLGKKISAVAAFRSVPLVLSFRSTAPVLSFADALFATDDARAGVSSNRPLRHALRRVGEAGRVELWPLKPRAAKAEVRPWDAPVDQAGEEDPRRVLAAAIAIDIQNRIRTDMLASRGRTLRAGDFMILVQSRGPLFHEMIRALNRAGVPVAGADKMKLLEEPAVEDVLSFARAVLLSSDDLSLAETLKSPFFDFDEAALFDLAHGRTGTLRAALGADARWAAAAAEIDRAERVGVHEGAFAFVSHILESGSPSGRKRLYARLRCAAEEPLNELLRQALDYERGRPRSLRGFVSWAEMHAGEIKRDLEQASDAVRVMTAHGAKGLQSEVVILLDAHAPPNIKHLGPLFFAGARNDGLTPIFSANKESDSAATADARDRAKRRAYEEYRRLLYVAATRARDRLIVCGLEIGKGGDPRARPAGEMTWHALSCEAFDRLGAGAERQAPWGGDIRVIDCAQQVALKAEKAAPPGAFAPAPDWLDRAAAPEKRMRRITPSGLGDEGGEGPAYSPLIAGNRLIRGRTLHRLIEVLPDAAPEERPRVADRLLARLAPGIAADERGQWRDEALAVIDDPAFAPVFSKTSRAEAAIAGRVTTARGEVFVSGQIDRLAVAATRVLLVDFKTNRPPPRTIEEIPQGYVGQLAAYRALLRQVYPGRQIEAGLLWTYEARLMRVPDEMLDHAFARLIG